MMRLLRALAGVSLILLAACDSFELPDWLGGSPPPPPLPGKRIAVLAESSRIKPDDSLASIAVTVPDVTANPAWDQAGGSPEGITGNLHLSGTANHDKATIGDGNGWEGPLYSIPIVAEGSVYAMDAKGYITAHDAQHISDIRWTNQSFVEEGESRLLGGGLAYADGKIYATSGRGRVAAMDAKTGKEIWKQSEGIPLRAPPKVLDGRVYVLSVDNQLFALDATNGTLQWSARGISEGADFLASISPAATSGVVIAPYSSGELHAIDPVSGQDLWSDSLLLARRTYATAGFSGIGGNPIIKDDIVYAAGSSGFFAAISLANGRRLFEQDITSLNTPWIAGDFLYVLSVDYQLICLERSDGRIKWIVQLPRYKDEVKHKDAFVWRGPVMAEGRLLVAGLHGVMLALSPTDGKTLATIEIPENITDAPIIAGGRLYLLTQDAKLHSFY